MEDRIIMDRIEQLKKEGLKARLLKGAAFLGDGWRAGQRCKRAWSGSCVCGAEATDFCKDKMHWVKLLLEYHGGWPYELTGTEEFTVIEAMTIGQFEASGLTARVELPGVETPLRFGAKGTVWTTLVDLAITVPGEDREAAIVAVQKLQKHFDSSKEPAHAV